ncbi:DUF3040 domain-containing protein [Nocardioides sp. HDW12B]|uniref:DUF3040 domain-containing protein n=1 Tax=Nocardioides sp. HDW12B TaxID=2714939 RepID=UPI00140AC278|nr:DUF3040 domain-containing protein [Nocardioides sp. HDW12B]QIK66903.1 DUF3040 domain-containing protein [Nocardioides sp. HDW12B]
MPLSEEELRLLEQMERALVAEDPKLASTLRGTKVRQHQRRAIALGVTAFVVGIVLLMSGAVMSLPWLGVIGFVVMLAAVFFTLTRWKSGGGAAASGPQAPSGDAPAGLRVLDGGKKSRRKGPRGSRGQQPSSGTMMDRFEERWRRRREGER